MRSFPPNAYGPPSVSTHIEESITGSNPAKRLYGINTQSRRLSRG